ncbi:ABC transporter ATP-binding protein [Ethanoligenens harbinense]|uniref:ABC transporter related protein n=1 Tax=Ethanoligenens harbinense (strain DSM 18485 / JCM 12961 / CGMCC 1.5033 / YUAN-3) TaxID=663278 RepID=E6U309_ETHHY|nr:ABC transporter related protein [Ethanoligenens harbinense YUAN-3]
MAPMAEMKNITKDFPGVRANDRVSFSVEAGEIHALLGENGAGKSTLMSVLTGLYMPDEGEIRLNGKPVCFSSPKDAVNRGIGMVHQHFKLVQSFTVAENVMLSMPDLPQFYSPKEIERKVRGYSEAFGLSIDPRAKVYQLSVGQQQRVEIIKLLCRGANLLILDEPTAVLTPQEADQLYATLHRMAGDGKAVILISHKMREVMENTDRITVLRDGRSIDTVVTKETNEQELVRMMVGREIAKVGKRETAVRSETVLELRNVSVSCDGPDRLHAVSMAVHAGEIFGVAGVDGNGQKELADLVAGLVRASSGSVYIEGRDHTEDTRRQRIDAGVAYVPEDRMTTGLVTDLGACENMALLDYRKAKGGWIPWRSVRKRTDHLVEKFDIKLASISNPVKMLSGGNIQKLLLAREIESQPKLIIAVYPMRGLDIGAADTVRRLLIEQSRQGRAILLISEDMEELLTMSDRIAVLHGGEIMGCVRPDEASQEEIGLMMAGRRKEGAHAS